LFQFQHHIPQELSQLTCVFIATGRSVFNIFRHDNYYYNRPTRVNTRNITTKHICLPYST